jgi:hypothetical protein
MLSSKGWNFGPFLKKRLQRKFVYSFAVDISKETKFVNSYVWNSSLILTLF